MMLLCRTIIFLKMYARGAMLKLTKEKGSDEELAEKFDAAQRKYCRFLMDRLPEWVKDNEAALAYAKKNLSDLTL